MSNVPPPIDRAQIIIAVDRFILEAEGRIATSCTPPQMFDWASRTIWNFRVRMLEFLIADAMKQCGVTRVRAITDLAAALNKSERTFYRMLHPLDARAEVPPLLSPDDDEVG